MDIVERLSFDATRCELHFSKGVATNIEEAAAEIQRLRHRNAALVEIVRDTPCPYDGRATVAECQQCGCTHGLFTRAAP